MSNPLPTRPKIMYCRGMLVGLIKKPKPRMAHISIAAYWCKIVFCEIFTITVGIKPLVCRQVVILSNIEMMFQHPVCTSVTYKSHKQTNT